MNGWFRHRRRLCILILGLFHTVPPWATARMRSSLSRRLRPASVCQWPSATSCMPLRKSVRKRGPTRQRRSQHPVEIGASRRVDALADDRCEYCVYVVCAARKRVCVSSASAVNCALDVLAFAGQVRIINRLQRPPSPPAAVVVPLLPLSFINKL